MIMSVFSATMLAAAAKSTIDSGERVVIFGMTSDGSTVTLEGSYDNENWETLTSLTAAANVPQRIDPSIHRWYRMSGTTGVVVKLLGCDPRSISTLGVF